MASECESVPVEGTGSRLAKTFGPALAGLLGGAMTGLAGLAESGTLGRNVATTYTKFASLDAPSVASFDWPPWLLAVFMVVGIAAPVGIGIAVVWLARPKDRWEDLSAGLTAGLAATLAALVARFGGSVVLALVVVPSLADLTLATDTAKSAPALAERYPDLESVEAGQRGNLLMAKIVSDQVAGATNALWVAAILALLSAGSLAVAGTLAAGHLARQGTGWRAAVVPYLELTIPPVVTFAMLVATVLLPTSSVLARGYALPVVWPFLAGVAAAFVVVGALARWPAPIRICLRVMWVLLLVQEKSSAIPWWLTAIGILLTGFLLCRHWVAAHRRPVPAGI